MGNIFKKGSSILLVVMMILGMVGCSKGGETTGSKDKSDDLNYPTKNLSITVPYGAGGVADVISRKIASLGDDYFKQSTVVENMTGAGGTIAATDYLKQKANTHNIMLASRSIFATIPLVQDVKYTYEDFEPVIGIENIAFILYVNPKKTNINSIEELVAYGKDNIIKYGTAGAGTDIDLIQSGFLAMAGVKGEAVVYGGAKEAINNVAAGHIDVAAATPSAATSLVKDGTLMPIAVVTDEPFTGFEGITVPTLSEQGYDINYPGLNFFVIRAGTKPEIVNFLYEQINAIYKTKEFQEFKDNIGIDLAPLSPKEIDEYITEQKRVANTLHKLIEEAKK